MRLVAATVLALLGAAGSAWAQQAPDAAGIDRAVEQGLKAWQVPGLALVVVRDGKVVMAKGYGVKSLKTGEPVSPDSLFYLGSATKSFTATLAAMMVEDGKADWDRPLREAFPGFRMADATATEKATLRDLLGHRTGVPRQEFLKVNAPDRRTDLIDRLRYFEPTLEFRWGFQYCNETVTVAGDLLGRAAGTSWEELLRNRLFVPLGMSRSVASVAEMLRLGDVAHPYIVRRTDPEEMAFYDVAELRGPAGGIVSSANDLSKWLLFNLGAGVLNERRLLPAAALAQLWVPRVPATRVAPRYPELTHQAYGLGWFVDAYRGSLRISHPGNLYGFTTIVSFLPREKMGVAVLANLNATPLPQIVERLVYDTLLGLTPVDWTARFREENARLDALDAAEAQKPDPGRMPGTKPSRPLEAFAGSYSSPGYGTLRLRVDGTELAVTVRSGEFPLRHYNYDVFEFFHPVEAQRWLLAFRGATDGGIGSVAVEDAAGAEIVFSRDRTGRAPSNQSR